MWPIKTARIASCAIFAAAIATSSAQAYVIDFDSEGFTGPSLAGATTAGTISVPTPIGNVQFSGGAVLNNTTMLPADTTSLYYTSFFLVGASNPITITFPSDIKGFSVNLYNGETYS